MSMFHRVLLVLLVAASFSCTKTNRAGYVVKVGGASVSQKVFEHRVQIERHLGAPDPREAALANLILANLGARITEGYAMPLSGPIIENYYWGRVHEIPVIAELEREVAVEEKQAFITAAALPEFSQLVLGEIYATLPEAHSDTAELTLGLLSRAIANPDRFDRFAHLEQLPVDRIWVGADGIRSASLEQGRVSLEAELPQAGEQAQAYGADEHEAGREMYRFIAGTPAGQIHPRPVVSPEAFQIVKVEERRENQARLSLITVAKTPFEDWFWKQAETVPVAFGDTEEGRGFLRNVPWARRMMVDRSLYADVLEDK